jgi:hypothetical protein
MRSSSDHVPFAAQGQAAIAVGPVQSCMQSRGLVWRRGAPGGAAALRCVGTHGTRGGSARARATSSRSPRVVVNPQRCGARRGPWPHAQDANGRKKRKCAQRSVPRLFRAARVERSAAERGAAERYFLDRIVYTHTAHRAHTTLTQEQVCKSMSCHEISSHDTHSTRDTRMAGGTQPSTLHGSREPSADTLSRAADYRPLPR